MTGRKATVPLPKFLTHAALALALCAPCVGAESWIDEHPAERSATDGIGGAYFHFATLSGGGNPVQSSVFYFHEPTTACLQVSGGGTIEGSIDLPIHLPDGHRVTFFRAYFRDPSDNRDGRAFLTPVSVLNPAGPIAEVQTSGTPGFGSIGAVVDYTVDNGVSSLVARFGVVPGSAPDVQLCAVRLAVTPPPTALERPSAAQQEASR